MIVWFTVVIIGVSVVAGLLAIIVGFAGRAPADLTMGATLLVELLLIAQVVIALLSPAFGNLPTGSGLEFWIYLVTAAILPPLAVVWGLVERNRWSTVILGVSSVAVAIMVYRMYQIWFVQLA